jgi:hypothetical protein
MQGSPVTAHPSKCSPLRLLLGGVSSALLDRLSETINYLFVFFFDSIDEVGNGWIGEVIDQPVDNGLYGRARVLLAAK